MLLLLLLLLRVADHLINLYSSRRYTFDAVAVAVDIAVAC
jgi:hypothetical protein